MTRPSRNLIPNRWLPFFGPKLGLAKVLYSLATDPDDLDLHQVFPAVTSMGRLLCHEHSLDPHAGGAGLKFEEAVNRAMGELLERYALFACDGGSPTFASYLELLELGQHPVPLAGLSLFSPEQHSVGNFPYAEFNEATPMAWVKGTNLLNGLPTCVPGQLISLDYFHASEGSAPFFYPTSSGCAVATSVEEALFKGLLEIIERDAVMIRWYARLAPPRLDIDPIDLVEGSRVLRGGLDIQFHDLTVDGTVPVVAVTCIERTGRPCFFILSAAAGLDVTTAARKALVEGGQGRPFIKSLVNRSKAPNEDAVFNDFESNLRFYAEPSNASYVEWFLENHSLSAGGFPPALETRSPLDNLKELLERCESAALTPIAFDITTSEMRDSGLFACKLFVPELVPLCIPSAPFLGHPRLARFINSHELRHASVDIPDWLPHPFP